MEEIRPFLTIVTRRHPKRPSYFRNHSLSIERQTCQDYQKLNILDEIGRGVAWANRVLNEYKDGVKGEYVFILDDDDILINNNFIRDMKLIAQTTDEPEVIFVKGLIGRRVLPTEKSWKTHPVIDNISTFNFVVRADVWKENIHAFGVDQAGDYAFINQVCLVPRRILWVDEVYCMTQRVSGGQAE